MGSDKINKKINCELINTANLWGFIAKVRRGYGLNLIDNAEK